VYKASQVVQKHFMMVQKSSKGAGLLQMMENNLFGAFSLQMKERDRGSKKMNITNKYETAINSQFTHAKHTKI